MRIERRLGHLALGLAHGHAGGTRACASKRAARAAALPVRRRP